MGKSAVTGGLVAVPGIIIQWVGISIGDGFVYTTEDDLVAYYSPGCTSRGGVGKLLVEPAFLGTAHQCATGVIADIMDIIGLRLMLAFDNPISGETFKIEIRGTR